MTAMSKSSLRSPGTGGPGTCAGCGSALAPKKPTPQGGGRPRKWCSERCRKGQYAGECIDCGAPTNGYAGPGQAAERCPSCRIKFEKTDFDHAAKQSAQKLGRNQWTNEQILAAIRRTAKNGVASKDAYNIAREANRAAFPSVPIIARRYGRWALAVQAAGLRVHRATPGYYANRRPDSVLLSAVRDCAAVLGRRPTYSEYEAWARLTGAPSGPSVRARLGAWVPACERALNGKSPARGTSPSS